MAIIAMASTDLQVVVQPSGTMEVASIYDVTATLTPRVRNSLATTAAANTYMVLDTASLMVNTYCNVHYISPVTVPPLPEAASTTNPATATGLVVRALPGIVLTPNHTPTIVNGKPT